MSTGIIFDGFCFTSAALSPASVAANTTAEQLFTFPGILATDMIIEINKPTAQAGLGIVGKRVSAANQIGITFSNNTASPIVPTAAQTYLALICRPEKVITGADGLSGGNVIFK